MEYNLVNILRDRQLKCSNTGDFSIYACFFRSNACGKNRFKIIFGENSPRFAYSWIPIATHAEIDALQKLKIEFMKGNRRPFRVDLMVVRLSKTGIINNAEPCMHCMRQLESAKFVDIKHVYYSTRIGSIVCKKFSDMVKCPTQHISSGYRKRMKLSKLHAHQCGV